ncbi:hypothetical protein [Dyella nitratireducens]|uniref:Secreted protein n=1 Tax=Dyella nitratireducens TaxID=1849580 RepID=A0ABQ1GXE8_9GAMM|nr:hypothetical protein [Dyella nitratireducens]GGA51824.1 hypothetical protein GCM10010981_46560 [Dyella nitratireducens]GLQ41653.1 hypothetical protein GCM10007902_15030 [Dyella nitratireducens]
MFTARIFASTLLALSFVTVAHAIDNTTFTVAQQDGNGKPIVFQSTSALKKGDMIKVYASNAQPVLILQVAMCDEGCLHPRLVKTLPLTPYYAGQSSTSQQFVLPEDGQVSFWVQRLGDLPSTPVNASNGQWTVQYVDPFLRFATQTPYDSTRPMPANAFSLNDNTLRARFLHRTFVTVSLADADH